MALEQDTKKTVIQRTTVNEQILQYMQEAIRSGKWKTGEKIPSEAELSEFFGASKLTVRVALQQLIGMEVLEKRIGDGTYVKAFDFGKYVQKGLDYYMRPELLDQVCDFRLGIELKCCELAIRSATDEELKQLSDIGERFSNLVHSFPEDQDKETQKAHLQKIADADVAFHRQICQLAHNDLLLNAFEMASEPIRQYVLIVLRKRILSRLEKNQEVTELKDIHKSICDAIIARDYTSCAAFYKEMIDRDLEL